MLGTTGRRRPRRSDLARWSLHIVFLNTKDDGHSRANRGPVSPAHTRWREMRARTARDEGNPGESGRPVARPRTGEGVREGGGGGRAGRGAHQHPTNLDNLNLGRDRAARASPGLGVRVALRAVASHFAVELKLSRIATALATKRPRAIAKTSAPSQHEGVAATVFW